MGVGWIWKNEWDGKLVYINIWIWCDAVIDWEICMMTDEKHKYGSIITT